MSHSASENSEDPAWDVIVIGGGPAGSTAATFLAKKGRRVLVLEKSKFPRFHIGESLLPYNRPLFEELGVWEKIRSAGFMEKRGAQFIMGNGSLRTRVDFACGQFTEFPASLQVERSKFDQILLDHSSECGAFVQQEALVTGYRMSGSGVEITWKAPDGTVHKVQARFLIDASGLANFTANAAGLRQFYPGHRKMAIFGHFRNLKMPDGPHEGDILIVRRADSWFWMIPLSKETTSVGYVLDLKDFRNRGAQPEDLFFQAVAATPEVRQRFDHAISTGKLTATTDFSYRNRRLIAPCLVRVGDASGFIDPIFSSGVLLAMTGARQGAEVVHEALANGKQLTAGMKAFEKQSRRQIGIYWEFIEKFYQDRFSQLFLQPWNKFGLVCAVQSVLAGRMQFPFALRWRLRVFFLIARLNQYIPLAPRIRIE